MAGSCRGGADRPPGTTLPPSEPAVAIHTCPVCAHPLRSPVLLRAFCDVLRVSYDPAELTLLLAAATAAMLPRPPRTGRPY